MDFLQNEWDGIGPHFYDFFKIGIIEIVGGKKSRFLVPIFIILEKCRFFIRTSGIKTFRISIIID